jgi:hypothetical protein
MQIKISYLTDLTFNILRTKSIQIYLTSTYSTGFLKLSEKCTCTFYDLT